MLARAEGHPRFIAFALLTLAAVQAMSGEAQESRQLYLRAKAIAEEMGIGVLLAVAPFFSEHVGLLFVDAEFTEREARAGYERLEAWGTRAAARPWRPFSRRRCISFTATKKRNGSSISQSLCVRRSRRDAGMARAVNAKLLATKRDFDGAERVARDAVERSNDVDDLDMRAYVLMSLGEVLNLAGRDEEAKSALEVAADLSDRKGNVVRANDARARLAKLDTALV